MGAAAPSLGAFWRPCSTASALMVSAHGAAERPVRWVAWVPDHRPRFALASLAPRGLRMYSPLAFPFLVAGLVLVFLAVLGLGRVVYRSRARLPRAPEIARPASPAEQRVVDRASENMRALHIETTVAVLFFAVLVGLLGYGSCGQVFR